jgi:hypothetical protein
MSKMPKAKVWTSAAKLSFVALAVTAGACVTIARLTYEIGRCQRKILALHEEQANQLLAPGLSGRAPEYARG